MPARPGNKLQTVIISSVVTGCFSLFGWFANRAADSITAEVKASTAVGVETQIEVAKLQVEVKNIKDLLRRVKLQDASYDAAPMPNYPGVLESSFGGPYEEIGFSVYFGAGAITGPAFSRRKYRSPAGLDA